MKDVRNQIIGWWEELVIWWREQTFVRKALALLIGGAVIVLCFVFPDAMRNLILLTVGLVGWYFLYRRTKAAEEDATTAKQNAKIADQGLIVDRLARATQRLNNEKSSIRLGGILGLEQIFKFHEEEHYKIIRILSAFVHDFAPIDGDTRTIESRSKHSDIEEAVSVLANITKSLPTDEKKILFDLYFTNLSGLGFAATNLSHFNLLGANFSNSLLYGVDFIGARLGKVNFSRVDCRNPKGLTQEQLGQAFYWKGQPPIDFPTELELTEREPDEQGVDGSDYRNG